MRAVAAVAVAALLLALSLPAEAHPFPKTEKAARGFVRDVLADVDQEGADALRLAQKLVRESREAARDATPTVPGLPTLPRTNGDLEVRTSLVQPGIQGRDEMLSAMWVGAAGDTFWNGAYWVESNAGSTLPALMGIDPHGIVLVADGGSGTEAAHVDLVYHFLGMDGKYVRHAVGRAILLPEVPVRDAADVGGADASTRGESPEALFLTPWNLFDHNATIGFTLHADDRTLNDTTAVSCVDYETPVVEPGCRLLYIIPFHADATHLTLWHVDEDGQRVVDRTLGRVSLEAGYTFR